MRTHHHLSLSILIPAVAVVLGATYAKGDSLSVIPTLTGDTANEGRAITPDGQYVVGLSGSRGFLYQVGALSSIYVLSSDSAGASIANGVGYRTSGGNTEMIISGMSSGHVTEWMTPDGGTTFGGKRRNTTFTYDNMGVANQLGSALGSDAYYVTSSKNAANQNVYVNKGSGPWVATMTYTSKGISGGDTANMNGISASGLAVGYRTTTGVKNNYALLYNGTGTPTPFNFAGLAGNNAGQAFSVNANGSAVFGQSPNIVGGTTFYGYKATLSGTLETSIGMLPNFGDTAGSVSLAVPYGASADGRYAVGMDYRGIEKAVLWDTADPNSANWTVTDLTALASSEGILDGWIRLTRAYSVGVLATGEEVVTGIGVWSPDGGTTTFTRAFVLEIPEPATIALLALGGLLVLRRRK